MNDEKLRMLFTEGEALLDRYKKVAQEIADELALRLSMFVFNEPGAYRGEVGGYDAGVDTISLCRVDGFRNLSRREFYEAEGEKYIEFRNRLIELYGVRHICIDSY